MKIALILNEPYPEGMACTRRIHLYAKGLKKLNNDVIIVIPRAKSQKTIKDQPLKGEYQGVRYYHTAGSIGRSKNIAVRKWRDFIGPINAFYFLKKWAPDKIIIIGSLLYHSFLFKALAINLNSSFIREKSEVPYYWKEKLNLFHILKSKFIYSIYDGLIVISPELSAFFKEILQFNSPLIVIPIINEYKSIRIKNEKTNNFNVLYTGSLLNSKDGITSILSAINIVKDINPDVTLTITGNAKTSPDYAKVMNLLNELKLKPYIKFTGYLSEEELIEITSRSSVLISIKPNNRQNRYNFPTKLGEYLSTGIPVLSTMTPAIKEYLSDGENIYICENDPASIADKLITIFKNYTSALLVGSKGKIVAEEKFDYLKQMSRLNKYLTNAV